MTPETTGGRRVAHPAHLFVPATRADLPAKAATSPASAVILDLEDSVPADQKEQARKLLAPAASTLRDAGKHVCVRVNNSDELLAEDVHAALAAGVAGLVVPKVEGADLLQKLDAWIAAWETDQRREQGLVELELQIETPRGVLLAPEIAAALPRVSSMMLGVEDFSTELGIDPDAPDTDLGWAHARVLLAATAAGLHAYGLIGSFSNFRDLDAYGAAVRRSRAFGYVGAYCIHPAQAELAVAGFAPSASEVDRARRVIKAYEDAEQRGQSATSLDGTMIDRPIAERARRLLDRAGAARTGATTPATKETS